MGNVATRWNKYVPINKRLIFFSGVFCCTNFLLKQFWLINEWRWIWFFALFVNQYKRYVAYVFPMWVSDSSLETGWVVARFAESLVFDPLGFGYLLTSWPKARMEWVIVETVCMTVIWVYRNAAIYRLLEFKKQFIFYSIVEYSKAGPEILKALYNFVKIGLKVYKFL